MPAARNNLALAYAASGRIDLARSEFVAASDRASGLYNTGIVYLAAGDYPAALNAFDEASKARPTFHLARERARQIRAQMFLTSRRDRLADPSNRTERATGASARAVRRPPRRPPSLMTRTSFHFHHRRKRSKNRA